jgi:hypothetical protein
MATTTTRIVIFQTMPTAGHGTYLGGRYGTTTVRKNATAFPTREAAQEEANRLQADARLGIKYQVREVEVKS